MKENDARQIDKMLEFWLWSRDNQRGEHGRRYTGRAFPTPFQTLSDEEIKARLGRKWKSIIPKLITLAERIDEFTPTDAETGVCREFYLSSTDAGLLKAMPRKAVSRMIDKAVQVGMMRETSSEYKIKDTPKAYIYNPYTRFQLSNVSTYKATRADDDMPPANVSTYKACPVGNDGAGANVSTYKANPVFCAQIPNVSTYEDIEREGERASLYRAERSKGFQISHQNLGNGNRGIDFAKGLKLNMTDTEIMNGIHQAYPMLHYYQSKIENMNKHLPPLFKMTFNPSITRAAASGTVSKIGIRYHSPLCQTLSGDFRKGILKSHGFNEIHSFDIKSSIYRVTYLLNFGRWMENDLDFYELMKPRESFLDRKTYKLLAQRLYFCSSPADCFQSVFHGVRDDNGHFLQWKDYIPDDMKAKIIERLETYWDAMRGVVGTPLKSAIFYHESALYIDLLAELWKRGIFAVSVYDGFYSPSPDLKSACLEILPELAARYLSMTGFEPLPEPLRMRGGDDTPKCPETPLETPLQSFGVDLPMTETKAQETALQGRGRGISDAVESTAPDAPQSTPTDAQGSRVEKSTRDDAPAIRDEAPAEIPPDAPQSVHDGADAPDAPPFMSDDDFEVFWASIMGKGDEPRPDAFAIPRRAYPSIEEKIKAQIMEIPDDFKV